MRPNPKRQPQGVRAGGQFAEEIRSPSAVSLPAPASSPDAREAMNGIVAAVQSHSGQRARELQRLLASTSALSLLAELDTENHRGRCSNHADEPAHSTTSWCSNCVLAQSVEHQLRPAPEPRVYGAIPGKVPSHHLVRGSSSVDTDESAGLETTTTTLSGDKAFNAGVCLLLEVPEGSEVTVTKTTSEDYSHYTSEYETEITVAAAGRSASYPDLGALMRAFDASSRPDPKEMALRFMRAKSAARPLLHGTAAVFLDKGPYSDPEPVYGHISNVFDRQSRAEIEFLHRDGRREYLHLDRIKAILETDQSGIYPEPASG